MCRSPTLATCTFYYQQYNNTGIAAASSATSPTVILYPNPAATTLHIRLAGPVNGPSQLRIYDAGGSLVQDAILSASPDAELSIARLSPGSYTILLKTTTGEQSLSLEICT